MHTRQLKCAMYQLVAKGVKHYCKKENKIKLVVKELALSNIDEVVGCKTESDETQIVCCVL